MDGLLASQSGIRDSPGPENFIFFCLAMMPIHFSHHGGINLTNPSLCPRGPSAAKDKGERLQQSRTNLTRTAVTKATVKRLAASELRVLQLKMEIFTPCRCLTSRLLVYTQQTVQKCARCNGATFRCTVGSHCINVSRQLPSRELLNFN